MVQEGTKGTELCMDDLAVTGRLFTQQQRRYASRGWLTTKLREVKTATPVAVDRDRVCLRVPRSASASPEQPSYLIVDVTAQTGGSVPAPARVHMWDLGTELRVVGLERPDDDDAPGT